MELLSDLDRVRTERRQAKANRSKYVGTGNSGGFSDGSRYGGFGNDSYGGNDSYSYDNDNGMLTNRLPVYLPYLNTSCRLQRGRKI